MTYMGSDKYGLVTYISVIFLPQNVSTKPPHVHYLTVYHEWGAASLPHVFQGFTEDISWHWGYQWGDNPEESDSVITSLVAENIWSFEAAEVWESVLALCWAQAVLSCHTNLSHLVWIHQKANDGGRTCVTELSKRKTTIFCHFPTECFHKLLVRGKRIEDEELYTSWILEKMITIGGLFQGCLP